MRVTKAAGSGSERRTPAQREKLVRALLVCVEGINATTVSLLLSKCTWTELCKSQTARTEGTSQHATATFGQYKFSIAKLSIVQTIQSHKLRTAKQSPNMWKKIVEYFLSCFPSATFLTFSKRFMIFNRLSSDKEMSLFAGLSPLGPLVHSHLAALPSGAMQTIDAVRIRWQKVPQQTERVTSIASCFWWWSMISPDTNHVSKAWAEQNCRKGREGMFFFRDRKKAKARLHAVWRKPGFCSHMIHDTNMSITPKTQARGYPMCDAARRYGLVACIETRLPKTLFCRVVFWSFLSYMIYMKFTWFTWLQWDCCDAFWLWSLVRQSLAVRLDGAVLEPADISIWDEERVRLTTFHHFFTAGCEGPGDAVPLEFLGLNRLLDWST